MGHGEISKNYGCFWSSYSVLHRITVDSYHLGEEIISQEGTCRIFYSFSVMFCDHIYYKILAVCRWSMITVIVNVLNERSV